MRADEYYALLALPHSASREQIREKLDELDRIWLYRKNGAPSLERRQEAERWVSLLADARRELLHRTTGINHPAAPSSPLPHSTPHSHSAGPTHGYPTPPSPGNVPPSWPHTPRPNWPSGPVLADPGRRLRGVIVEAILALVTLGWGWIFWALALAPSGRTPAKQVLKMRVVDATTGQPPGFWLMFTREVLAKGAVALIIGWTAGIGAVLLLWLLWDGKRQQLWDKVVGTVVLDERGSFA